MALTPRAQLKRLVVGTVAAVIFVFALIITSHLELPWLFYLLATGLVFAILYALPGYLGIWLWRMRKFLFDLD